MTGNTLSSLSTHQREAMERALAWAMNEAEVHDTKVRTLCRSCNSSKGNKIEVGE
jgi:hypothetical protein